MPDRTPLYAAHQRLQARIVDFHGWEMPIQYVGVPDEHAALRTSAGVFDLSHMGRVKVRGKDRRAFLQRILTVDVDKVQPVRCRYTFYLNEKGTIIDDLIFYADRDEDLLVVNASNREKDIDWMKSHLSGDVQAKTVDILKQAADRELTSGRGPTGVAAAAIYISSILSGERRTQREVAEVAGVTEVTIRNRYKELTDRLGIRIEL